MPKPARGVDGQQAALQWEPTVLLQSDMLRAPETHVKVLVPLREDAHRVQHLVVTLRAAAALRATLREVGGLLHLASGVKAFATLAEPDAALVDVVDRHACGLGFLQHPGLRHPRVLRWRGTQPRTM